MEEVASLFLHRQFPELVILFLIFVVQAVAVRWILRGPAADSPEWARQAVLRLTLATFLAQGIAVLLGFHRISKHVPYLASSWGRGAVMIWTFTSLLFLCAYLVSHALQRLLKADEAPPHAARRQFLRVAQASLFAAPAAAIGYGMFIERKHFTLREQTIAIPNLPADLNDLRIVQITDIHLSPFLSERDLAYAVDMANEAKANIALMTGDIITNEDDPLDAGLRQLARLRSDAGTFCCMGNHEFYSGVEKYAEQNGARMGMKFLRRSAQQLKFGGATLNLAGVDYQNRRQPYLVGAEKMIQPDAFNVLLSHNPDVFPVAAKQGYPLTIAGHTHGGQVRVEILNRDLNVARFYTPYVDGLYQENESSIFVSRGLGTIGLPARIGSAPEVALLRLCRT